MNDLLLGAAVALTADGLVCVVLALLAHREPSPYLRAWALAYLLFQLTHLTTFAAFGWPEHTALAIVTVALATSASLALHRGADHFAQRATHPAVWAGGATALVVATAALLAGAPLSASGASIAVLQSAVYASSALVMARASANIGARVAAVGFGLSALHLLDFPIVAAYPALVPWGLALHGMLQVLVGLGLVLAHADRVRVSADALVQQAAIGIYRTTPAGRFELANPALVRLLGYADEAEVLALRLPDDLYADPTERQRLRDEHAGQPVLGPREVIWKRKDGSPLRVELTGREVRDSGGALVAWEGFARDVTHTRALEAELARAQRIESLGRLAGGVAHDFNNLLTVILGNLSLIESRDDDGAVREARLAAERGAELTRQLLLFGRPRTEHAAATDAVEVLNRLQPLLRRSLGSGVQLSIRLPNDPCLVAIDPAPLEQIAMNLVLNARDAMPNGGTIDLRLGRAPDAPDRVRLEVRDDGEGIAPDVLEHIFDPFFTTRPTGQGTGLGLSTVYAAVTSAGGAVTAESQVGVGTRLRVDLPTGDPSLRVPTMPSEGERLGDRAEIWVVDDQDDVRALVVRVLRNAGHTVRHTGKPSEALDWSAILKPALLLSDVWMPDLNGPELVQALRVRGYTGPVLYMSGFADPGLVDATLDAPLLRKPFGPAALREAVAQALIPMS